MARTSLSVSYIEENKTASSKAWWWQHHGVGVFSTTAAPADLGTRIVASTDLRKASKMFVKVQEEELTC